MNELIEAKNLLLDYINGKISSRTFADDFADFIYKNVDALYDQNEQLANQLEGINYQVACFDPDRPNPGTNSMFSSEADIRREINKALELYKKYRL